MKQKNLKDGVLQLLEKDFCLLLIFSKDETIFKSKAFIKSRIKSVNKLVFYSARKEFKKWLEVYWRDGYLENDDLQLLTKNK